jgi:F0F1-type ATP synthase epsilon subunit
MVKRTLASTGELVDIDKSQATEEELAQEKTTDGKPTMDVKVYAPFKVYFEGKAVSITAVNETGPFDVLPHHHNFLCMLVPCELIIQTPFDTQKVKISRALMHVKAEKVTVFVDV